MKNLFWIALGLGGVYAFFRLREGRALEARAEATPDSTMTGTSAPAASGWSSGNDDAPMVQFPGTFDEFSDEQVNVGGDLPTTQTTYPPSDLAVASPLTRPPLSYTDEVTAEPVALIEDRPAAEKAPWKDIRRDDDEYSIQPIRHLPPKQPAPIQPAPTKPVKSSAPSFLGSILPITLPPKQPAPAVSQPVKQNAPHIQPDHGGGGKSAPPKKSTPPTKSGWWNDGIKGNNPNNNPPKKKAAKKGGGKR